MNRIVTQMTVASVLLLLWISGFVWAQVTDEEPQNPLAGSRVFSAKGCSICHAMNGFGGKIGPDLARISSVRTVHDLAAAMWNHLPGMVEQMRELNLDPSLLNSQEAADLVAFLSVFNYFDPPGNPREGEKWFTRKKCVVCHQANRDGEMVGPSLHRLSQQGAPIFLAAAMWNHGPAMTAVMQAKGIERPTLKKQELLDIIAYLRSLIPDPRQQRLYIIGGLEEQGRTLFRSKGCINCHSMGGQGGQGGPDLATLEFGGGVLGLAVAMWNKAPPMLKAMEDRNISIPQINAGEMAHIVAYLYDVKYFTNTGDAVKGRKLVDTKGCLTCHSLDGRGGKRGGEFKEMKGYDSSAKLLAELWNHVTVPSQVARRRMTWPKFMGREMADLEAFLQEVGRSQRK